MSRHILVIGPAWIGDMVMAQVLFKLLKADNDAVIDVLAPVWSIPILARMPEVNQSIEMPLGHGQFNFSYRRQLGHSLRGKYDQAIVLPNSLKSALIPFFANIAQRTGWLGEWRYGLLNDIRRLNKLQYPLMIERFAALAFEKTANLPAQLPWPQLNIDSETREQTLLQHQLVDRPYSPNNKPPVLVLCPGAEYGSAKRWPEEHFAAVAEHFIEQHQDGQIWIMGSEKDAIVAEKIIQAMSFEKTRSRCRNLCGQTQLAEAIDLMSYAQAVVTNDSGLMHIAAALQLPIVAVYGSSSPAFTPPLADQVKILKENIECSPCFERECPLEHKRCLTELKPQRVVDALSTITANKFVAL